MADRLCGSTSKECATCQRQDLLIISCEEKEHSFCLSCVTTFIESSTTAREPPTGLAIRVSCPLGSVCGSQLEPYLLQDIIDQITAMSQEKTTKCLSHSRQTISSSCPNEECSFISQHDDDDFDNLYLWCPKCVSFYCRTCRRRLGDEGYADHICPPDRQITDIIDDVEASITLCKVVCEAKWARCPSNSCRAIDLAGGLIEKAKEDCNAIQCRTCQRFFCFICTRDLGTKREDAVKAFPHKSTDETNSPCCWLFDDGLSGNTETRAILIRQMNAASDYLCSLQLSKEKKFILLYKNREVLGDVFTHLITKYGPRGDQRKCIIL